MPTRIIRDGIIDSRAVNALSEPAEILYRRLMSIVDDYGRFEADPELIRARCFPRQLERWTIQRITDVLPELTVIHGELRLVTVYSISDKNYLQINNFGQRVQCKEKYPSPDSPESTVIHGDSPSSRSRSSVVEGVVVETPKAPLPKKRQRDPDESKGKRFDGPPTLAECAPEWAAYCKGLGWPFSRACEEYQKFGDYWRGIPGARGRKTDWLATWRNRCRERGEFLAPTPVRIQPPPVEYWKSDLKDGITPDPDPEINTALSIPKFVPRWVKAQIEQAKLNSQAQLPMGDE